ncbi:MAG: DUF1992 domain-containing protein [Anaerolineales bacterium]|nr:DUF1992 domain-containing protein [Chloroflexota bacterium]MBL6980396.1 DUF1992 domain-containing protein [Anaerolineales bacterium]
MKKYQHSIDEQIRRAMEDGQFENLPGKGQPIDLSTNPHEDPSWSIAFRAIRSSGHTLPWIEKRQQIEADLESACQSLKRAWEWNQRSKQKDAADAFTISEWKRAQSDFRITVADLNKRIFNYNLEVPSDQFQRRQINVDGEIERIIDRVD